MAQIVTARAPLGNLSGVRAAPVRGYTAAMLGAGRQDIAAEPPIELARREIRRIWGFETLRPLQEQAIIAGLSTRDALVVLPTGGGKSLCYQAPPLATGRTDVVVSPLIALMNDQVGGLREVGYPAAALHSGMSPQEQRDAQNEFLQGNLRLLFTSPERLFSASLQNLLHQVPVRSFAIDEAHCISHWGHDFRPEYRRLAFLRETYPQASFHAFTATATPRVQADIVAQLNLRDPQVLVGDFDRPNLIYRVVPRNSARDQTLDVLRRHCNEAAIVYCMTRRQTEELSEFLKKSGVRAAAYHAGLDSAVRRRTQDAFALERIDVVVATVAFGMGIDRSDVRCVIHTSMPRSIEHYQQESGRAGRDSLPAECVLLYSGGDLYRWEALIAKSVAEAGIEEPETVIAANMELLGHVQRYAAQRSCRHRALVEYFGQAYEKSNCGACDVCLAESEYVPEATILAQKILSCVARVKERFGAGYVVDVLRGVQSERVLANGHASLSTFGLLREQSRSTLTSFVDQLLSQGLLRRTAGDLPVLELTPDAWAVLRGQRTDVWLVAPRGRGATPVVPTRVEETSWENVDRELFEKLRTWRRAAAAERGVPAFLILSDNTLRDLARLRPRTPAELLLVAGFGEKKARAFGADVLRLIGTHHP